MSYADGRAILDADSHLMELPGFLEPFMEPDMVEKLAGRTMSMLKPVLDRRHQASEARAIDAAARAEAEERLWQDKGWNAMGSFDPEERSHVLDLFGFDGQLAFATFATASSSARTKTSSTQAAPRTTTQSSTSARTTSGCFPSRTCRSSTPTAP